MLVPALARPGRQESGYSLIEVLAATALLLIVLLSIMGMFLYGGRSVNSGKLMTKATSIAGDVLEEFRRLLYTQTWLQVSSANGVGALSEVTWSSTSGPANSDAVMNARLTAWANTVQTQLPKGEMIITVRGLASPGNGASDPTAGAFNSVRVVQVVVTVKWREARRIRSVVFETLRS